MFRVSEVHGSKDIYLYEAGETKAMRMPCLTPDSVWQQVGCVLHTRCSNRNQSNQTFHQMQPEKNKLYNGEKNKSKLSII